MATYRLYFKARGSFIACEDFEAENDAAAQRARGTDSFKSDPPNADISLLEGDNLTQIVVELRDPQLAGDDLVYMVKVLQGQMPAKAADVSVFIDVIGMPLTPFSYAGVARRAYRRAYLY